MGSVTARSSVPGAIVATLLVVAACSQGGAGPRSTSGDTGGTVTETTVGHAEGTRISVTSSVADEFLAAVVRTQDGGGRYVVRWPADQSVEVSVAGSATPEDLAVLDAAIAEFAPLIPGGVERVGSNGDVRVHFAPKGEWAAIVGDPDADLTPSGWTYTYSVGTGERPAAAGVLTEADIVIDVAAAQPARNRVIAHELGHALGLGHTRCPATLMFDGDAARPLWSLTPLDRELIEMLYDPRLEPGMSPDEVEAAFDRSGRVGALCGVVQWQLVEVDGRSYYCALGPAAQPCVIFDGGEPSAPILFPDGWVVDDRFSRWDPSRWEEFVFESSQLLCERGDTPTRPCVLAPADGEPAFPIVTPDYWTDGQFIYDTPP